METLRTIKNYSITSEKVDDCPHNYHDDICIICMVVGFISLLLCLNSLKNNNMIYALILFIITCISGFILILSFKYNGCGTIIRLNENNKIISSKSYQFTENPDCDVLEIKKIVDEFEKYANELNATNKKREEEQQKLKMECCNKYKSVIQKVK